MFTPFCFLILVIVCHIIYFFGWYERSDGFIFFKKDEIDTKERERETTRYVSDNSSTNITKLAMSNILSTLDSICNNKPHQSISPLVPRER